MRFIVIFLFYFVVQSQLPWNRIARASHGPSVFNAKFFDDMNLDDYYGEDWESFMKRYMRHNVRPAYGGRGGYGLPRVHIPSRASVYGYPRPRHYGSSYYPSHYRHYLHNAYPQIQQKAAPRLQSPHVYGNDYENVMENWVFGRGQQQQPVVNAAAQAAPEPEVQPQKIDKTQPLVLLLERNKYCRSPIIRLGNVNDAFECAEKAVDEANCSQIFYTGPLSNECTCAHISSPCVYEDSANGNSLFQVVTPQKILQNPQHGE